MRTTIREIPALLVLCLGAALGSAAFGQSEPEKWTVIYIGDSSFPEVTRAYAEHIEEDFGVDVFYTQRNSGFLQHATSMIRNGSWNVLRDADAIVVSIPESNDRPGFCTDLNGEQPFNRRLEDLPAMMDAFLASLTELADPETTIIRIANEYVIPKVKNLSMERGVEDKCIAALRQINAMWFEAAEKFDIPVVDFFEAWNGPDGTAQPPRAFHKPDGVHPSSEGVAAAAEILRQTGYQPREP